MIRRFISQPLPPALPHGALPHGGLPHDLQRGHPTTIRLEGSRTQALETGRTRLLVAAMSLTLAFALNGWRLADLALMAEQHEPTLPPSLSQTTLETGPPENRHHTHVGDATPS